ncbi:peptidase S8/S53 domain-containing protein [Daedaleopsis nitida]|nr:peptidase S8/S53 domain-containing protein [Daedaleopsis nitida]
MVAAGLLVLSLLPFVLARPALEASRPAVKDSHHTTPPAFLPTEINLVPGGMLRLTVAMPQGNVTGLHAALMDVSDPKNDNYGHHLTKAEVEQLVAPRAESAKAVKDWLTKNGISPASTSPSGDMLSIEVPVEQANALLQADFKNYVHEKTNTTMVRTLSYSLPADLHEHVAFIYPTTQFWSPRSRISLHAVRAPRGAHRVKRVGMKRADAVTACAQAVTPGCLQALYNIPTTPASAPGNGLAVTGFLNEIADTGDLQQFMSQFRPDSPNGTFTLQSIDNGVTTGAGTGEASLDMQYTVGLATNVPTTFLSVGQNANDQVDEVNFLLQQDPIPHVLTTSFGSNEPDDPRFGPFAEFVCNAYAQLGARGVSVLFASGDGGVSGSGEDHSCDGRPFIRTFPSGCPFVTSVGSTHNIAPETAAPFSAGGFSAVFPRPDYQDAAVEEYLRALGDTNAGLFNASGRAYPDVSTQGDNFAVILNGKLASFLGTSASSPTFASVIALINDQLLTAGKPPLGFLNPFLYSTGAGAFNDITSGSNPGCATDGFPALAGWDPVCCPYPQHYLVCTHR